MIQGIFVGLVFSLSLVNAQEPVCKTTQECKDLIAKAQIQLQKLMLAEIQTSLIQGAHLNCETLSMESTTDIFHSKLDFDGSLKLVQQKMNINQPYGEEMFWEVGSDINDPSTGTRLIRASRLFTKKDGALAKVLAEFRLQKHDGRIDGSVTRWLVEDQKMVAAGSDSLICK